MFSSGSFGQLRYVPEATRGVTPTAGSATNLRMTQPTLKAEVVTVKSSEIRPDRLSTGLTRTDMNVDGGFEFELSAKEYDPFLAGVIGGTMAHFGTAGLSDVFTAAFAANSITASAAPTGNSAFTGLATGSWIKVIPPAAASEAVKRYFAGSWFKVASTTATVITLHASTPIAAPGLAAGAAGFAISQSTIVNGSARKTWSFEHDLTDVGSKLLYTGMEANTLELSIDVGQIITGSFGFIGQGHDARDGGTFLPATVVPSQSLEVMNAVADVGLVYEGGSSLLSAGSFIQNVSLSINNNARGQKAVGVFGNAGVGLGELEVSGEMTVYFQDASYYRKWLNGTRTSLSLGVADAAGNGYLFEMDKVMFRDGGLQPGGNNEDTMLTLPFSAFFDPATNRGIRITRAIAAP